MFALCMRVVRVLDTLTLSITTIQEIGHIKRYSGGLYQWWTCTMIVSPIEVAKNTVLKKDSN